MNQQPQTRKVVLFAEVNVYFRKEFYEELGAMQSFKMAGAQAEGESWLQVVQPDGVVVFPREVITRVEMIPSKIDRSAGAQ